MSHPLHLRLAQAPVLLDGAMGTILHEQGVPLDACFDALNLSDADKVAQVHRAYIAAGADIIETNTFGASRYRLEPHGLAERVKAINKRAVRIAREEREISGENVLIAGSIGPAGRPISDFPGSRFEDIVTAYREQADALLEGGVDLFVIETMTGLAEMDAAITAVRGATDLPVIAMMTFGDDGRTLEGDRPETILSRFTGAGLTAIGANCSVGPSKLLPVMKAMRRQLDRQNGDSGLVLVCMPNAGWPTFVDQRVFYPSTPEYFASFAAEATGQGVRIVGGCCGTTPDHIRAMRAALDQASPEARSTSDAIPTLAIPVPEPSRSSDQPDEPTDLKQKLGRKFIVSVEIDPPKGFNPAKALAGARMLKDAGVDAINVADSPMARVRMSAMTLCYLIQHQVGIDTIVHFTTRDRSLMGLQSELLGAHAVGVRNILALKGDPPSLGDYPDSSAVYDVDSVGLIRVIRRMNDGTDSSGASIGRPASFTIACAVDPTKGDLDDEADRLQRKIEAGADLVMSQPIYDMAVWHEFLDHFERRHGTRDVGVPVLMGILPLQSSKHAEFLHNEVPGITLTDDARERMRRAGANGRAEGIRMAQDLLLEARPEVQGVYLMPSFGRYEVAADVISVLREREIAAP